ncbi:MAG: cytochrome c biogenesis protein CcdA [Elusimicrobiaceae bacterium]
MRFLSAFLGGFAAFFSPCILPLLPGYISLMSGVSFSEIKSGAHHSKTMWRTGITSIFFTLGFTIVFTALGASASGLGRFIFKNSSAISVISGILLVILGIHLTGLINLRILQHEKRVHLNKFHPGYLGALFMGMAFAAGWSPCIGPILAGFLAMAATQKTSLAGMALLAVFSAGLAVPFIIAGFASARTLTFLSRHKQFIHYSCLGAGMLLVVIGIALIFRNSFVSLKSFVPISAIF